MDFEAICEEYVRLADEAAGRTQATVVTASPLDEAQCERLRRPLSARTGQDVELTVTVDSTLIAGAIASVGAIVIDGSLRTQLEQMRASLTKG